MQFINPDSRRSAGQNPEDRQGLGQRARLALCRLFSIVARQTYISLDYHYGATTNPCQITMAETS